jgi:hypothetical protein
MVDDPRLDQEVAEHLMLLQRYLSDEVAPLVFAESLAELVALPPALAADAIRAWVASQYRSGNPLPIADYLFHAMRKLHIVGELELVARDRLRAHLDALQHYLLEQCPEADRAALAADFANIEDSGTVVASPVQVVHRAGAGEPARTAAVRGEAPTRAPAESGTALPPKVVQGLRRLDLLLDRLERDSPVGAPRGAAPSAEREALLSRFLAAAAASAADAGELEGSLDRVRKLGIDTDTRRVLRLLGKALPDWAPPATADAGETPQHEAVSAMRRVVALGRDASETARRYSELVHAAADEFNSGAVGRAVTMLTLASRMETEEKVDPMAVRTVRNSGWSVLDAERLRESADSPELQRLLLGVLQFFSDLHPGRLIDELSSEQRRERRRLLLSLLSLHGGAARAAALERLEAASTGASWNDWYVERNLIHILRRVPLSPEAPPEGEIDVLIRASTPGAPLAVLKEAIAVLGQHRSPRAEQTLIARVGEIEDALLGARQMPYEPEELIGLLDRLVATLARSTSAAARRCVVEHALKRRPQLGDTLARGVDLGNQDLSGEPELVGRLLKALRDEYPTRVFGLTVGSKRKETAASQLIGALAGTGTPAVREVLSEISDRFADHPMAADAQRVMSRPPSPPAPAPSASSLAETSPTPGAPQPAAAVRPAAAGITGDLGVFGLPTLLQNLSDSRVTGTLTLSRADGTAVATVRFTGGLLADAATGRLTGHTAFFGMLQKTAAERFAFVNAPALPEGTAAGADVLPLLMEAMRRLDEFQQAAALVPDGARLRQTDVKPNRKPDEDDLELMRAVWIKALGGATPAAIEAEAAVDPYRIRRLFEHWVEEGSLVVA